MEGSDHLSTPTSNGKLWKLNNNNDDDDDELDHGWRPPCGGKQAQRQLPVN